MGLVGIGLDGVVRSFPEPGGLWHDWSGPLRPHVIAGWGDGLLYATPDGQVGKSNRRRVTPPKWTFPAPVTALAANAAGSELFAISEGHVARLLASGIAPGPCAQLAAVSLAVADGRVWVSDGQRLYQGTDTACSPVAGAPAKITRLAGLGKRLLGVTANGDVFRLRAGSVWEQLPRPKKFRPDQLPAFHPARDVAVTGTAAWVVDDESNVFVLSESE